VTEQYTHIVLADDDQDDCFLFGEALEELGPPVQLTAVHNGEQLMQLLHHMDPLPDILFLDLNMPRKNGKECLSEIKKSAALKHLPVVIYSTSFKSDEVEELYERGAKFYIRKPSDFTELKRVISDALTAASGVSYTQPPRECFVLSHALP
jgi:CheY-like chemotaxis protein